MESGGWVYYPYPEMKKRNFQNPSFAEVIATPIPEIKSEAELQVFFDPEKILLIKLNRIGRTSSYTSDTDEFTRVVQFSLQII